MFDNSNLLCTYPFIHIIQGKYKKYDFTFLLNCLNNTLFFIIIFRNKQDYYIIIIKDRHKQQIAKQRHLCSQWGNN